MKPVNRTLLPKALTGITGLDELTGGGLPRGRPTLVCGGPGCGKTLLAMEFLIHGAMQYNEPGVFITFEEGAEDLAKNVASLGFDLPSLIAQKKLAIDLIRVERSEIQETGEYDLEGLFVRIGYAIDQVGAKRVTLDTIESLFSGLSNEAIVRAELRRLFQWLKDKGVTAVITGEQGNGPGLTRQGLEEYVSDCVIFLDHRTSAQLSTRRLRVVKYRGSFHGTNEYPFLIDEDGISVVPITSTGLDHEASEERVFSGIADLDEMLGGDGFYRGSSVLYSGTAGAGKTTAVAHFVDAACRRGERALMFAFEESFGQVARNLRSVGIDLREHVDSGLLLFQAARPTLQGLEAHLASMFKQIRTFRPDVVVIDPITSLLNSSAAPDVLAMLIRLIDYLKSNHITAVLTALTDPRGQSLESTDVGLSSIVDTWILLRYFEINAERNRTIYLLKSRGMRHSNQLREFLITDKGIHFEDVYMGPQGVLTGSARTAQMAMDRTTTKAYEEEVGRRSRAFERRTVAIQAQIKALEAELASEKDALQDALTQQERQQHREAAERKEIADYRQGNGKIARQEELQP